jgi:hypothetical protein
MMVIGQFRGLCRDMSNSSIGLSLLEASKQVGLSKVALLKSIKSGRISATKDDSNRWFIQPVELFRVYKPATKTTNQIPNEPLTHGDELTSSIVSDNQTKLAVLEAELQFTKERLADIQERLADTITQRDQWQSQAQAQTLLLTDNRQRGFLQRLFGK